ncbi:MAG: GtrA family protein [Bacteroides sp.]|nr:GtrA family protein [Eubacterium sp.]MCM1418839.1 GtrA family protein [Roseburia sp.]MCM1462886.1 GtrA family protein [Bacteroides sp.]
MKKHSVGQFIKFALVGVSNTVVNYLVYVILVSLGVYYLVANVFGFLISVLNAYFWGSHFVFKEDQTKEKRVWWKVLLKTYASYAVGLVLSTLLLVLWVDLLEIGEAFGFVNLLLKPLHETFAFIPAEMDARKRSEVIAPVLNMIVTVPINFIMNKFWAYRQKNISPGE